MKNKKSSPIWKISKKEFQKLIDSSDSYCDILRHFNLDPYSGNHRTLKARIKENQICLKQFNVNKLKNNKNQAIQKELDFDLVFKENSSFNNTALKRKILKNKLISYKCSECQNNGAWQDKSLSLQLDHINGVNNDNRIENLRFLCPNCHSQTKTYSGRNKNQKTKNCINCTEKINRKNKYCKKCRDLILNETCYKKKFNPSKEELIQKIKELKSNLVQIGKFYNVSDNAIRKRCIKLKIDWKNL